MAGWPRCGSVRLLWGEEKNNKLNLLWPHTYTLPFFELKCMIFGIVQKVFSEKASKIAPKLVLFYWEKRNVPNASKMRGTPLGENTPEGPKTKKIRDFERDWKFRARMTFSSEPPHRRPYFLWGNRDVEIENFELKDPKFSIEIENFDRDRIFLIVGRLGPLRYRNLRGPRGMFSGFFRSREKLWKSGKTVN